METALGCGYSNNEESTLTDFYSPPSSIADEEEEEEEDLNTNFSFEEIPEVFLSKYRREISRIESNVFAL